MLAGRLLQLCIAHVLFFLQFFYLNLIDRRCFLKGISALTLGRLSGLRPNTFHNYLQLHLLCAETLIITYKVGGFLQIASMYLAI